MNKLQILLFLGCSLAVCEMALARPDLDWKPSRLEIRQAQGSESQYSVTVRFDSAASDVVARVAPPLQPWVSVSPFSLGEVEKGDVLELNVLVSIPPGQSPGKHGGVIQLRSGKNQKNLASPLKLALIVTPETDGGPPPDPGNEGDDTLLGVDSDMDGVRDDVQRYILETYPDLPNVQKALFQLSRTYQRILDPELVPGTEVEIANQVGKDIECLYYVSGKAIDAHTIFLELRSEILNTRDRTLKYLSYDKQLSGKTFPLSRLPLSEHYKLCDFELN